MEEWRPRVVYRARMQRVSACTRAKQAGATSAPEATEKRAAVEAVVLDQGATDLGQELVSKKLDQPRDELGPSRGGGTTDFRSTKNQEASPWRPSKVLPRA